MNQVKDFIEYLLNAIKIWVIVQPWQTGLIVRSGKRIRKLNNGIYFKLPYFDSVYVQESRLRIADVPIQTLTSKDLKTITITGAIGYSIIDIKKLYETLYHPETTLMNIAMSEVAEFIFKNNLTDINPNTIGEAILNKLNVNDYGLKFEYFKVTNFAIVRTYRLIQDQSWTSEGLKMDDKK